MKTSLLNLLLLVICTAAQAQAQVIDTYAGGGVIDGGPVADAYVEIGDFTVADDGTIYVSDQLNHMVRAINTDSTISTIAGNGQHGYDGDDKLATEAAIWEPEAMEVLPDGTIYLADRFNSRIRKVSPDGTITTVAGTGTSGYQDDSDTYLVVSDGAVATSTDLEVSTNISLDQDDKLVFFANGYLLRLEDDGTLTVLAGINTFEDNYQEGGQAIGTNISGMTDFTILPNGSIYFTTYGNYVRMIDAQGVLSTVAGDGTTGFSGDGGQATESQLNRPRGIAAVGNDIYIADANNHRIRKIDETGTITTVAGNGGWQDANQEGVATDVPIAVQKINVTNDGSIYFSHRFHGLRKIDDQGMLTVVSRGTVVVPEELFQDSIAATDAKIKGAIWGVGSGPDGSIYFQSSNLWRLLRVDADGILTSFVGTGEHAGQFSEDGLNRTEFQVHFVPDVAVGNDGTVYFIDQVSATYKIRQVDPSTGVVTTLAGSGGYGDTGDGGPAVDAPLGRPISLAVDSEGNVYFADLNFHKVRKVDAAGIITTVAGTGVSGDTIADSGIATESQLNIPRGVAIDSQDNLYIADANNRRVLKVDANGILTRYAGNGSADYDGDGGLATGAGLSHPADITFDSQDNLYIATGFKQRVRKVDTDGIITTYAGTEQGGYFGDGGLATDARLYQVYDVAIGLDDQLFISSQNDYIRVVYPELGPTSNPTTTTRTAAFKLYPNPARSEVIVEQAGAIQASIVDMQGRTVLRANGTGRISLQLDQLTAGLYVVKVNGDSARLVIR